MTYIQQVLHVAVTSSPGHDPFPPTKAVISQFLMRTLLFHFSSFVVKSCQTLCTFQDLLFSSSVMCCLIICPFSWFVLWMILWPDCTVISCFHFYSTMAWLTTLIWTVCFLCLYFVLKHHSESGLFQQLCYLKQSSRVPSPILCPCGFSPGFSDSLGSSQLANTCQQVDW